MFDSELCIESLEKVFKKNPKNIVAFFIMGRLMQKANQRLKAESSFIKIIK